MYFIRKARYVANRVLTDSPVGLCYFSVVSRDTVIIAFLVAALNDLDNLEYHISNGHLHSPCRERIWFVVGLECGKSLEETFMKLVRAFYGLKSSGSIWRNMFKDHIVIFWD